MIVDWLGKKDQIKMARMGADIEQAGIESNIESSRLQTEDESLQAMINLRKNMGTQAALFAARGTAGGAGTALVFGQESVGNFNADERIRRINQKGNEARLKAGMTLSKLHQKTYESNVWNEFRQNAINKIPTRGFTSGSSSGSGGSYGLTGVGG
jgi:hypothetical protein